VLSFRFGRAANVVNTASYSKAEQPIPKRGKTFWYFLFLGKQFEIYEEITQWHRAC
jgi:hypothetical protein